MNKKNKLKTFIERNKKSNGYLLRKTSFNVFYKIIRFVLLFGLCFMILQPLLNKISISFMEEQDLYDSTIVAIPRHFTLSNYQIAAYLMKYWQALANTALISLLVSVLQIISCTLVGYGFARYKFPLKGLWFAAVILVIVVPPTTIQASLFLNFRFFDIFGIIELITGQPGVNLLNSLTPYALMSWLYGSEEWFVHLHDSSVLPWNSKRIGRSCLCGWMWKIVNIRSYHVTGCKTNFDILFPVFLRMAVDRFLLFKPVFEFRICSVVQ